MVWRSLLPARTLSELVMTSRPPITDRLSCGFAPVNMRPEAIRIARLGRMALIAEAELTPKPGLVDRRGPGTHRDLSLDRMRCSAFTIERYFRAMAFRCFARVPSQDLREQLAGIGREAERAMLAATGGSNTHKGAIWILGLLGSAASMHAEESVTAYKLASTAQQIANFEDRAAPIGFSHGEFVAAKYGVAGARGEAASGFPHVVQVGLPTLRSNRVRGLNERQARLHSLLGIMASLDDTCLLYRGGRRALAAAKDGAYSVLEAGGIITQSGRQQFRLLERTLLALNVSPGGSADLLAATLFTDALERGSDIVQPDNSESEGMDGAT